MKVFLIVVAVIALLISIVLSLSAELTVIFDNGWTTRVRVLFIEKDIELSKILSFVLFPEKKAVEVTNETDERKKVKTTEKTETTEKENKPENSDLQSSRDACKTEEQPAQKQNYFKKLYDEDGIVGIMLLISNLLQTVNSAVTTLFKGLHIYSLYVKMIIGGGDAADIAQKYGEMCSIYYPVKGIILNGMKVDNYDDFIQPDFIAPRSEYEFQFIGSINIALVLKILIKAGCVFLVNLVKNK